jgi:PadR family transcriptional regulator PadR
MGGRVTYLGEFEQVVLLAIVRLGDEAYGTGIRREIEARSGRWVSIGAAYATLDRLVAKGYLRPRDAAGAAERGGRSRRFFAITPAGIAALEEARDLQRRMWAGVQLRRAVRKS